MEIKEITYTSGNDFKAIFKCKKCEHEFEKWGYSDKNYYENVLPNAICPKCGLNSKGEDEETSKKKLGRDYVYRI